MTVWISVYLTVPYWWTFRCFQFVFPINNATMNIFVQLSLCVGAVSFWEFPGIGGQVNRKHREEKIEPKVAQGPVGMDGGWSGLLMGPSK